MCYLPITIIGCVNLKPPKKYLLEDEIWKKIKINKSKKPLGSTIEEGNSFDVDQLVNWYKYFL